MKKLTPILIVDEIEPCLPLWDELGFERTLPVPSPSNPDKLAFIAVRHGDLEIMYQSREGLEADIPQAASESFRAPLYIEVEDLAAIEPILAKHPPFFPKRETFYGATEIGIKDHGGHLLTFAEMSPAPADGEAKS